MNMRFFLFAWLFVSLLLPGLAMGEARLIHVELSYSGAAASYILYQDGVQVCTATNPDTMDCTIEMGTLPMTFELTAVDAEGVESPPSAPYILVPPSPDPNVSGNFIPQANFTTTATNGEAPLSVSFDAGGSSDLGGLILNFDWDFGDGDAGSGELIDHTFASPGTYTVTLTVGDDDGASDVETTTITVAAPAPDPTPSPTANKPPVAVLAATPPSAGETIVGFAGSDSSDLDGTIASYSWSFGDGDSGTGVTIEHEYLAPGDYTAVLTVTDNQGASSQDQMIISVVDAPTPANLPPVVEISASSQQHLLHFFWDYVGTAPDLAGFRLYQNSRLVCDVADPAARAADCLTHVDNGMIRLWVTAYDLNGVESGPSAPLTFDGTGLFPGAAGDAPLAVHFTSGASADPDGTISSYSWDFGDGSMAEGMATDHVFTGPGDYMVTLTVIDDRGDQAQATTHIHVTSAQPPLATNSSLSTIQDKPVTAILNASDPEGSPLTFRVIKDGALGTATITNDSTGVFTYVPKAGVFGTDTFTFKANDGTSDSNEAVVSISILKKNSAPTATDMALTAQEDEVASATLQAMDSDNDPLTFSLVAMPTHGSATLVNATAGTFTYMPQANYHGTDSFTYKAHDGTLDSAVSTVAVTVHPVNDAPTTAGSSLLATEDVAASGKVTGGDLDGDSLTYSLVTNGSKGVAVITDATTGVFTYIPAANESGQDSFVYRVSDGQLTADAVVSVSIAAVNDSPAAAPATLAVTEDFAAAGQVTGADPDGDTLTYSIVTNGSKGVAVMTDMTTGALTYTPLPNKNGQDSFTYRVSDGKLASEATVTVAIATVNDAPTAAAATLATTEDVVSGGQLSGVDADGDPLAYAIVTNGSKGVATIIDPATGAFTYTPSVNQNGQDSFVYRVSDGLLMADATVVVTITAVNDAPIATATTLPASEDVVATGQLPGSDLDGDTLTYSITTNGSKGKAVVTDEVTGAFTYTSSANENGQDSFVYRVNDGKLTSDATVSVAITAVNDAPLAAATTLAVTEDVAFSGHLSGASLDGNSLTYSLVSNGNKGTAVITDTTTGAFTYTPTANKNGEDSFIYRVSNGVTTADAVVTVTIAPVNDPPAVSGLAASTMENVSLSEQLLGADPDGDSLIYTLVSNGHKGTAVITDAASGAFSYTPFANQNGQDTFSYRVSDGLLTAEATVTLTIAAVNVTPTASAATLTVTEDGVSSGQLSGADPDGDSLTFSIVSNGSKGVAVIAETKTGLFTYTPSANQNGQDSFVYRVSDGLLTADATVPVTIVPVNDAPVAEKATLAATEDVVVSGHVSAADPDGDSLTYAIIANGQLGQAVITDLATGAFTYTPVANKNGQDIFVYRVSDGNLTAEATVLVTIVAAEEAPTATTTTSPPTTMAVPLTTITTTGLASTTTTTIPSQGGVAPQEAPPATTTTSPPTTMAVPLTTITTTGLASTTTTTIPSQGGVAPQDAPPTTTTTSPSTTMTVPLTTITTTGLASTTTTTTTISSQGGVAQQEAPLATTTTSPSTTMAVPLTTITTTGLASTTTTIPSKAIVAQKDAPPTPKDTGSLNLEKSVVPPIAVSDGGSGISTTTTSLGDATTTTTTEFSTTTTTISTQGSVTLNPSVGWNLLTSAVGFEVPKVLGDSGKFSSVWKWEQGKWAVYLPGEDGGASYTKAKGFTSLIAIAPGEGFWVNAKSTAPVTIAGTPEYGALTFASGWNLVGLKSAQPTTVADFIAGTSGIVSLWKWENGKWAVCLPGEVTPGAYAAAKGFGNLTTINPGEGFWVYHP